MAHVAIEERRPEPRRSRRAVEGGAGGTPLFLEESVRAPADAGVLAGRPGAYRVARPIESLEIPSTVQAVLAARIDCLPAPQKSLLQTAAAIAQDVPVELLLAIADLDCESVQALLAELKNR